MRAAIARLARLFADHPVAPLTLAALLAAGAGVGASRLAVDPGNEALFLVDDPAREGQAILDERFGGDGLLLVALEGDVLTEDGLAALDGLTLAIQALGSVDKAVSLTTAKNVYQGPLELYAWAPYEWYLDDERTFPDGRIERFGLEALKKEVLEEPLFVDNLVSRDGRMAAIAVALKQGASEGRAVEDLRRLAKDAEKDGLEAHIAGFPVERYDFAKLISDDQARFVPLIVIAIAIVSFLLFRQVWGVALPLAVTGLTVLVTLGTAHALSVELNAVTSLLTPVVMVVSVAVALNICIAYTQERAAGIPAGPEAIEAAYRRVGLACLFTTLTTVLGFGALGLADVPAIRDFGRLCALGVASSYAAALLILPALFGVRWARGPRSLVHREGAIEGALARLGPGIARRRGLVLGVAALCLVGAGLGVLRLRVETDILAQLPERSPLAAATRAIDARLGGVNTIELLWEGKPGAFRQLGSLRALAALRAWLAEDGRGDLVRRTFSVVDIIERLHAVKKGERALPATQDELDYYFGILDRAGEDTPTGIVLGQDAGLARFSARLQALPASKVYALLQGLTERARALAPEGITVQPAGEYVLLQNMTHHLPRTQGESLILATACIIGAIALLMRSLGLALVAALPASLPLLCTYGLMGWLGIDLSTATSMIATVVIGLAVDATILFLARYRDERAHGLEGPEALARMLGTAGQSVTYSNLALVAGFSVGALSSFPPVRDFSVLTAGTIACTYLGAVFILPALLSLGKQGR